MKFIFQAVLHVYNNGQEIRTRQLHILQPDMEWKDLVIDTSAIQNPKYKDLAKAASHELGRILCSRFKKSTGLELRFRYSPKNNEISIVEQKDTQYIDWYKLTQLEAHPIESE